MQGLGFNWGLGFVESGSRRCIGSRVWGLGIRASAC